MRLVFHVGIHKTASSLLQAALAENEDWLAGNGVFYLNSSSPYILNRQRDALRRLQNPARSDPAPDTMARPNRRMLRMARSAGMKTILISEENRIGVPLYRNLSMGGETAEYYPDATTLLRFTLQGLEALETQFLVYTREFQSWLPSMYSEALRSLSIALSFDEFLQRIDFSSLDNAALIDRIGRSHPRAEVVQQDFERIRQGASEYQRDFVRQIVGHDDGFAPVERKVRPSFGRGQLEGLLGLAREREVQGMTNSIRRRRNRIQAQDTASGEKLELPAWASARLAAAT